MQKLGTRKKKEQRKTLRKVVCKELLWLGMGINFQNVEYVIHYGPPHSVTEMIQQSGRAGRSGQQAFSIV